MQQTIKTMKKNIFSLALLLPVFICTLPSQSQLPTAWQPGMTIEVSYGGGMRYYSYELLISDTGSYFMENHEGRILKTTLTLSKEELNRTLEFLREKAFDRIETEMTVPMHDKGSETITISWDHQRISKGTGHAQEIVESHKGRYLQIRNFLLEMRMKKKLATQP